MTRILKKILMHQSMHQYPAVWGREIFCWNQ